MAGLTGAVPVRYQRGRVSAHALARLAREHAELPCRPGRSALRAAHRLDGGGRRSSAASPRTRGRGFFGRAARDVRLGGPHACPLFFCAGCTGRVGCVFFFRRALSAGAPDGRGRPRRPRHPHSRRPRRAGRGSARRVARSRRKPKGWPGGRHVLRAHEARSPLQGRKPHRGRASSLGLRLLRRHRGRPRRRRTSGVTLRFIVRERPNIKDDRVTRATTSSTTTSSTRPSRSSRTRS